ncbi:MAG: 23S rRNA (uracil(1939)-C(5))-methyltransferase RlmD [Candidatus Berkelbacteria bacterium]
MKIKIEKLIYEGWGLGHQENGRPVFVKKAVPDDTLEVNIVKEKKSFDIGQIKSITDPSEKRIKPFCPHFDRCGSCEHQCLSYPDQLAAKADIFRELFERSKIRTEIFPIISGSDPIYYRGNMRYGFVLDDENQIHLAMHDYMTNQPFAITECYLQSKAAIAIALSIVDFINTRIEHKNSFWQLKIRDGKYTGDIMVEIITTGEVLPDKNGFISMLKKNPTVTSAYHTVSPARSLLAAHRHLLFGSPIIHEKIGKFIFQISPDSFFQTNSLGVKNLYDQIKKFANVEMGDTVIDLYCGTGTIGIYLSTLAKKVIGVESVQAAINDAKANAKINKVHNVEFILADATKWLEKQPANEINNTILILDPPRAGLQRELIKKISTLGLKKIVYVSCNPATFARDITIFASYGLKLEKVQPIDMFPQNHHIECIGVISK